MRDSTHFVRYAMKNPVRTTLMALCACLMAATLHAQANTQTHNQGGESQITEGFVNAPVAEVWRLFTTSDGYKTTGVADAEVDLKVGGTIRAHYDPKGKLGDP